MGPASVPPVGPLVFCLYLAGNTPVSARAVVNTRRFCEEHFEGRYELEIVDISLHPERVQEAQIIAAPTLVEKHPLPEQLEIGDMSRTDRLVQRFDLAWRPT
ncbi:MAG: circadian clock KaiB family protein [Caldimonas sp.]